MTTATRPMTVLVAALGGEGGGVLTDWLVEAAKAQNLPVQSTSIPGVAQRTGATTYYIEVFPEPMADAASGPVMALYPAPGNIDIMICSELLEAGRAMESGFVSPDRTALIASTHRVFSIAEKSAMADGRYDTDRIVEALNALADRTILTDFAALARREGTIVNTVLLGAIAGAGILPIPRDRFEDAIRHGGIAVESSLRGFSAGYAVAAEGVDQGAADAVSEPDSTDGRAGADVARYPEPVREIARLATERLADYQDRRYVALYLDRLDRIAAGDGAGANGELLAETARHLALWMAYEDVIRVADLKTRRTRTERIRREVGASADEPLRITEFLKPGAEEVAAILPPAIGRRLRARAARRGKKPTDAPSLRIRTDWILGFLTLWLLARMRFLRRATLRYKEEQQAIDDWLAAVAAASAVDHDLAREVVECARLLKGYSETHQRGRANYAAVMDEIVRPALSRPDEPGKIAERIRLARTAALSDPEGFELDRVLSQAGAAGGVSDPDDRIEAQGGKAA